MEKKLLRLDELESYNTITLALAQLRTIRIHDKLDRSKMDAAIRWLEQVVR